MSAAESLIAIRHPNGSFYVGASRAGGHQPGSGSLLVGPAFGGTKETAARFFSAPAAVAEANRYRFFPGKYKLTWIEGTIPARLRRARPLAASSPYTKPACAKCARVVIGLGVPKRHNRKCHRRGLAGAPPAVAL